jgi:two-component system sensor histidine kinase TctE
MAFLLVASGLITFRQADSSADLITDHNLLASARVMAQGIHIQDGVLEALISPSALEMLASPDHDMVYYQVRGPSGTVLAGQPDLELLKQLSPSAEPTYADGTFRGQDIRLVQIGQPVTLLPIFPHFHDVDRPTRLPRHLPPHCHVNASQGGVA